jgi:hypothetical protein
MSRRYVRDSRGRFASTGTAGNLTERLRAASTASAPRRLQFEVLHHGTSSAAAAAIKRGGYRESRDGTLGPGVYAATKRKEARGYARIAESPGVGDKEGPTLRHRLQKGRHPGVSVEAGQGNWEPGYRQAQQAKGAGQLVRGAGQMSGVVLMDKARADRTLDRSTGRVRVPVKKPGLMEYLDAAAKGQGQPKAKRPRWNRRRKP